jgi:hypothetical protein
MENLSDREKVSIDWHLDDERWTFGYLWTLQSCVYISKFQSLLASPWPGFRFRSLAEKLNKRNSVSKLMSRSVKAKARLSHLSSPPLLRTSIFWPPSPGNSAYFKRIFSLPCGISADFYWILAMPMEFPQIFYELLTHLMEIPWQFLI